MKVLVTENRRERVYGVCWFITPSLSTESRCTSWKPGDGPPVFLLHGFPETWYPGRHQIPELARNFR